MSTSNFPYIENNNLFIPHNAPEKFQYHKAKTEKGSWLSLKAALDFCNAPPEMYPRYLFPKEYLYDK